jgi:hypothetical protein
MTENIFALAPDNDLKPEFTWAPIDGEPTYLMNADGVIALARKTDTPAARRIYRDYRKRKAQLKRSRPDLNDAALRQQAIVDVLPIYPPA